MSGNSAESTSQIVELESSDHVKFPVERKVAEKSNLIRNMLEDIGGENEVAQVPLPQVSASVLKKVLEYCERHKDEPSVSSDDNNDRSKKLTDISEWDQKFLQVDQEMLFEIILTANYLDIKPLLEVGCKTVANMIKGKTPEDIRKTFNITNDFTEEEERQIRRENEWAEDR